MTKSYEICVEDENDFFQVENLTREAFWNVYQPGCNEHYLINCVRNDESFIKELSLVIKVDNKIIGHIMYMKSIIDLKDGNTLPIITFGPFSILPEFQGKGYGAILLNYSMEKAKNMGFLAIGITGFYKLYSKFGFEIAKDKGIFFNGDENFEYFLIKELKEGCLNNIKGDYILPKAYNVDNSKLDEFDEKFPAKQKLKSPTQIF